VQQSVPMSFEARVLTVLIASPGDTSEGRDRVEETIASWNRDRSRHQRVALLGLRWEVDSVPELGGDGQEVINRQLVSDCDIVVALFHSRLGSPTARSESGTAEEIERARQRGIPVHVYFSEMPLPRDVNSSELERLQSYKVNLQSQGLLGTYVSLDDLAAKVRTALERDVIGLVQVEEGSSTDTESRPHAILRARYERDREPHMDGRGRTRMRTANERLVIENIGSGPADRVVLEIEPIGDGQPPMFVLEEPIERIASQSSVQVHVARHGGIARQWRVAFRWQEAEELFEDFVTVVW